MLTDCNRLNCQTTAKKPWYLLNFTALGLLYPSPSPIRWTPLQVNSHYWINPASIVLSWENIVLPSFRVHHCSITCRNSLASSPQIPYWNSVPGPQRRTSVPITLKNPFLNPGSTPCTQIPVRHRTLITDWSHCSGLFNIHEVMMSDIHHCRQLSFYMATTSSTVTNATTIPNNTSIYWPFYRQTLIRWFPVPYGPPRLSFLKHWD